MLIINSELLWPPEILFEPPLTRALDGIGLLPYGEFLLSFNQRFHRILISLPRKRIKMKSLHESRDATHLMQANWTPTQHFTAVHPVCDVDREWNVSEESRR